MSETPEPRGEKSTAASSSSSRAERVKNLASSARDRAADAIADAAETAHARLGDAQAVAADSLEAGAQAVRGRAPHEGRRRGLDAIRERLGDTMEDAAYGLRSRDIADVGGLVADATRANPWGALLVAFAAGALTAMVLSRSSRED